ERVVVENQSRERCLRELIRAAERHDIDLICDAIRIVAPQPLRVDAELRAQLVRRLVSDAAVELKQTAATGIERRILAKRERRGAHARILITIAEIEVEVPPTMCYLPVELNLLAVLRTRIERQVLLG